MLKKFRRSLRKIWGKKNNRGRILIIDDEKDFTDAVKLNLEDSGAYEVMTENKGVNALAAAKSFRPDLILLDIIMPDIDGGAVLTKLKEDPATTAIPVVFLTAIVTESEVNLKDSFIGGHPFIAKPVTTRQLVECIEKNINKRH